MRAARFALCLAAALVAAAGPSYAAEPLPDGTGLSSGAPPLVPEVGPAGLPDWANACIASGRRQAGTARGGDLLYAAGIVLARDLRRPDHAVSILEEAAIAYPESDAFLGLVLLESAELRLALGDLAGARRDLADARARSARALPVDATASTLRRHALLAERVTVLGAPLGVRIAEAAGDLADAATQQEDIAAARDRQGRADADAAWGLAARLHARAGDRAHALAAVDRALELAQGNTMRANLAFWRVYLEHDLLDEQAAPSLGTHWPGDAFEEDVRTTLRGLPGVERVGPWLLALASRAVTADRPAVALELYGMALRDPALLDRARDEPQVRDGLLVAFPIALELGRLDEAERILETLTRAADPPTALFDGYRVALARARAEAARKEAPVASPPELVPAEPGPSPSPHRGRLYPHGPPEQDPDEGRRVPPGDEEGASESASRGPLLVLSAAAVLLLFGALVVRRRRRRASLGGYAARR